MHEQKKNQGVAPTPNPELLPGPGPFPEPIPAPEPLPWPPDWWRCRRIGPVSGRYEGEMTAPNAGRYDLHLRIDIDPRYANSPVMDRVSGDIFQIFRFYIPFPFPGRSGRTITWRVYRESWIVDNPTVTWSRCQVEINGSVRYWKGGHPDTDVRIVIPWGTFRAAGPAEVTFTEVGGSTSSYSCDRQSHAFRELTLEVDVCQTVNADPILPSYATDAHPNRPAGLPVRTLTIAEAYREAGIEVTINPARSVIDDTALADTNWRPDELHDAMETYFSQFPGYWPKWHMWGLLASGVYQSPTGVLRPTVSGVMFDYSGAGAPPERQGYAIFRENSAYDDLVAGAPANDAQAAAMRAFLKTHVHEMGHAFNFVHSWDKGRPDSLSWMNYDWRYDDLPGNDDGDFWANFRFRFDDEELMHLRHGDRSEVIMGGDPWATGSHEVLPPGAMVDLVGEAPIELLLRSKAYFQFMEPVVIEFRIRNITGIPLELDTQLDPEYGGVIVYIRRPDGRIVKYSPIICALSTPELKALKPTQEAVQGEDRHSQNVFLSYGSYGSYFDEPGEYLLRAVYQGDGGVLITSNLHRLRIGRPFSVDEERIAQDFFSYEAGMSLYLNGSSSPFLKKGMDTLEDMADRFQKSPVGAHLSLILARNLARPFCPIEENARVKTRDANPKEALALTARALEQQERDESTFTNITYHQLSRARADLMVAMDEKAEAKKELRTAVKYLEKRGVNQPVLEEIEAYAKSL